MARRWTGCSIALLVVLGGGLTACSGGGGASVGGFCALVRADKHKFENIKSKSQVQAAAAAIKALVAKAPSDIKPALQTLSNGFGQIAKGDKAALAANSAKLTAATKRLETYAKDKCKIDISTG